MTTDTRIAAQHTGRAHLIAELAPRTRTRCGLAVTNAWSQFPAREAIDEDLCHRCWPPATSSPTATQVEAARHATRATTNGLTAHVEELLETEVARATQAYAWHAPGHGEFILTRLGMRLERLERVTRGDAPPDVAH